MSGEILMAYHRVYVIERDYGKRAPAWHPVSVAYNAAAARDMLRYYRGRPGERHLWRMRPYYPGDEA
jgi:hypothetical protein